MAQKEPRNHQSIWSDLVKESNFSSTSSWWRVGAYIYSKGHGFSNYSKCEKRTHPQARDDVFRDHRIEKYVAKSEENRAKVNAVLDEMCHLIQSQSSPTRNIKISGTFFLKCISSIYTEVYVNNHLLPIRSHEDFGKNLLREQYLSISEELPVVILPTHRSYMDFLFISYSAVHYELPLPVVATGDNFKGLGTLLTNYLKSTGAFLVRRNAHRKRDIEASVYYDILRAYVHSLLKGGEHPLEFFMEGTRTRVGQVLGPKTGLLSMVVDAFTEGIIPDVYILPVAINYQRPIEEQLYIGENTPEIDHSKPKENASNLVWAYEAIMKRKYGRTYVRWLQPFKLSQYFNEWKKETEGKYDSNKDDNTNLHNFTNSLASKVCLMQAKGNVLMPFNLMSCSILSKSFLDNPLYYDTNGDEPADDFIKSKNFSITMKDLVDDFHLIESLLRETQSQFLPGWRSRMDIFEEFRLDRDNIVRASSDRRHIEFNNNSHTFHTMLYYSNQLIQVLIPVAICLVLSAKTLVVQLEVTSNLWEQYKSIRSLLSKEFFANEVFMKKEYEETCAVLQGKTVDPKLRRIILRHLCYFIKCYLVFLRCVESRKTFSRSEFFASKHEDLFISKDMLKNMFCMVLDLSICEKVEDESNGRQSNRSNQMVDKLRLVDSARLVELINRFRQVLQMAIDASSIGSQAKY